MEDRFIELVVKRRPQSRDMLFKALLIAGTAAVGIMGFLVHPLFFIVLAGFIAADIYLFPRFDVEYEYSYLNGGIDVAAIYSKQSRKELASITTDEITCAAPLGSHHLDGIGGNFRVIDFTSGDPAVKPFAILAAGADGKKYLLELTDEIIEDMRWRLPGKVFKE